MPVINCTCTCTCILSERLRFDKCIVGGLSLQLSNSRTKCILCWSFPRPAMAQTARVSSADMTDITPPHTAETSDIRHHTQHPKSRISSRRLPEAYGKHSFCASSAHATGLPLRTEAIRDCIGVVWAVPVRLSFDKNSGLGGLARSGGEK